LAADCTHRQRTKRRVFSGRSCWQLSPVDAAISNLTLDSQPAEPPHYSPKGPFLSESQDSTQSVRFSKFDRFELLATFSGKRFGRLCRIGESVRFLRSDSQFTISRFEILPPQPGKAAAKGNGPDSRRKARQWRAFAVWLAVPARLKCLSPNIGCDCWLTSGQSLLEIVGVVEA
jgi:hypothetical protein